MLKPFLLFLIILTLSVPHYAEAQKKGPKGPIPVIVSPVQLQDFADRVEALGTTKANETVVITPDAAEKVTAIHFEDGQTVQQGDLLISLNKSQEQAELEAAKASLSETQSSYNRAKGLQSSSALSKGALQERLAALKENQAMVEQIKARINKRDIKAPFDGILGLREVSVGTLVQPGDVITTIDDLSQIKVDFDVPAIFLSSLKSGMTVVGQTESFGARDFKGVVRTINTQVDPVTRTVTVRAVLPNEDGILKPGLLMKIILFKNERKVLLIPEEALIKRGENNFVFVLNKDSEKITAQEKQIEIGARQPGVVEVVSGLSSGDEVVVHGTLKVRDGGEVLVRAVEAEDQPLDALLKQNNNTEQGQ